MANKFIYFVIYVVAYSTTVQSYFLNDDLYTNLPDRFSDPVDDNWQDKRSISNGFSNLSGKSLNFPHINKESIDFDYKNGNSETEAEDEFEKSDKFEKRESKVEPLHENDIRQMLSKFSNSDRDAFDNLMIDESPNIDGDKRQLLKENFENSYHLNKRNNFKMPCKGLRCEEHEPLSKELFSEEDVYNNCPEKINAKRKLKFKRSNDFHSTSRENILQAKISLLKDNYKRSSEMRSLEDSAKRRYSKKKRKEDDLKRGS